MKRRPSLALQYASTRAIRGDDMDSSSVRRSGQWALLSGFLGLLGVALLIAALAAPTPSQDSMRRSTSLFAWQNAAVVLQAITVIPVVVGLFRSAQRPKANAARVMGVGLLGQITLILAAGSLWVGMASDMLYMAPIGVVGIWLLMVNTKDDQLFSRAIAWSGKVAGIGLLLIGIGFAIYGAFVAPAVFIRPLTNTELDAQALTIPNLIAHICMAVGTLFGRLVYPIWAIMLGKRMVELPAV